MKTSTEIASIAKHVGEVSAVELVARAGFDAWDFSMFDMARYDGGRQCVIDNGHPLHSAEYAAFAKKLRRIGEENGIHCNQSHAPFPTHIPGVRDHLKRAIECTAIAGGEICIIHPDNNQNAEHNAEFYRELLPFAKEHGVKIATENMFNWDPKADQALPAACSGPEDFVAHICAVDDPYFVACLDLGHAELNGVGTSAPEMILALGNHRLEALHVHDNDARRDRHQLPLTMGIDYEAITRALAQVGYCGYITLEADRYLNDYNKDTVFDGVCEMARVAHRIADMVEKAK